jgi:hypothetical protein
MKGKYEKKGPIKKKPIDEEYAAKYYRKKEARKTSIEQNNKRKCSQAELERSRLYKQQNKEKINETRRKYNALIMEDPIQRLKRNIKCQLLSKIRKTAPSTSYFGTNVNFIKTWLEFNFTDDMTWSNYGSYWQIDHTIAINLWDLASDEEVQTCFNWKNMMPLEKIKNNRKSARLVPIRVCLQEQRLRHFFKIQDLPEDEFTQYVQKYNEKFKSLLPVFFMQHAQIAGNP